MLPVIITRLSITHNKYISKDSLHKYSSTTKLDVDTPWGVRIFIDNEWVPQRDIYGSNNFMYALLILRIPAPGMQHFFHTAWHTLNQRIQHFLSDFPPYLVHSFSQLCLDGFRRSFECCCVRISLTEFVLEVRPEFFNGRQIGRICRPVHDCQPMLSRQCFKELDCSFSCVWSGIVLLKFICCSDILAQRFKEWIEFRSQ